MKNILFVVYGGGHIKMITPILSFMNTRSDVKVHILALTTGYKTLKEQGVEGVLSYSDLAYLVDPSYEDYGRQLIGDMPKDGPVSVEESIAYHGVNYLDKLEQLGDEGAKTSWETEGRQGFFPINFMKKVLTSLNIDLLAVTNSPRSERAAMEAAMALDIKSVCMVDLFALQEYQWIKQAGYGDKVCVLNDSVKNFLVSHGRSEEEVVVTGNPAFDRLMDPSIAEDGRVRKRQLQEAFGNNGFTILFASQPEPAKHPMCQRFGDEQLPRNIESYLRQLVAKRPEYNLIVRYHPSEQVEFEEQDRVLLSQQSENLHSLLHAVDCVIVCTSTVGLEAHLIGKSVISVDMSVFTPDTPYSTTGVSIGVDSIEELQGELALLFEKRQQNNAETISHANLNAASRVYKVMSDLLE